MKNTSTFIPKGNLESLANSRFSKKEKPQTNIFGIGQNSQINETSEYKKSRASSQKNRRFSSNDLVPAIISSMKNIRKTKKNNFTADPENNSSIFKDIDFKEGKSLRQNGESSHRIFSENSNLSSDKSPRKTGHNSSNQSSSQRHCYLLFPKKDESPNENNRKEKGMAITLMEPESYKLDQQEKNSFKSSSKTKLEAQKNFFKIRRRNIEEKKSTKEYTGANTTTNLDFSEVRGINSTKMGTSNTIIQNCLDLSEIPTSQHNIQKNTKLKTEKFEDLIKKYGIYDVNNDWISKNTVPKINQNNSQVFNSNIGKTNKLNLLTSQRCGRSQLELHHDTIVNELRCYKEQAHNLKLNHELVKNSDQLKAKILNQTSKIFPKTDDSNKQNPNQKKNNFMEYIKFTLNELLESIESNHFNCLFNTIVKEDQPYASIFKEYSELISGIIPRLVQNDCVDLAKLIEPLWKFLILIIDKLSYLKENYVTTLFAEKTKILEEGYKNELSKFEKKQREWELQTHELYRKISKKKDKNEKLKKEIFGLEANLYNYREQEERAQNLEATQIFSNIDQNLRQLSNSIIKTEEENIIQNKLLTQNISSLLTMAVKKNKESKTSETQTELSMMGYNQIMNKYGITEFPVSINSLLSYNVNPFVKVLIKDFDNFEQSQSIERQSKEESIDYIEKIFSNIVNNFTNDSPAQPSDEFKRTITQEFKQKGKQDHSKTLNLNSTSYMSGVETPGSSKSFSKNKKSFMKSIMAFNGSINGKNIAKRDSAIKNTYNENSSPQETLESSNGKSVAEWFVIEVLKLEKFNPKKTRLKITDICDALYEMYSDSDYHVVCGKLFGQFNYPCISLQKFLEFQKFKKLILSLTDSQISDSRIVQKISIRIDVAFEAIENSCKNSCNNVFGQNTQNFTYFSDPNDEILQWNNQRYLKEFKNQIYLQSNKALIKKHSDLKNLPSKLDGKTQIIDFQLILTKQYQNFPINQILDTLYQDLCNLDYEKLGLIPINEVDKYFKEKYDIKIFSKKFMKFFNYNGLRYGTFIRKIQKVLDQEKAKSQRVEFSTLLQAFLNTFEIIEKSEMKYKEKLEMELHLDDETSNFQKFMDNNFKKNNNANSFLKTTSLLTYFDLQMYLKNFYDASTCPIIREGYMGDKIVTLKPLFKAQINNSELLKHLYDFIKQNSRFPKQYMQNFDSLMLSKMHYNMKHFENKKLSGYFESLQKNSDKFVKNNSNKLQKNLSRKKSKNYSKSGTRVTNETKSNTSIESQNNSKSLSRRSKRGLKVEFSINEKSVSNSSSKNLDWNYHNN